MELFVQSGKGHQLLTVVYFSTKTCALVDFSQN
jgi:hypothetical protein